MRNVTDYKSQAFYGSARFTGEANHKSLIDDRSEVPEDSLH